MPNTYTKIASVAVGSGGSSSMEFTSIPQTYTDLVILGSTRSTTSDAPLCYRLNSTTSGYTGRYVCGLGSSGTESSNLTTLTAGAGGTWGRAANVGNCISTNTASTFANWQMYIPNYTSANNKSLSLDVVTENNAAAAYPELDALLWSNTAAITTVAFAVYNLGSFAQYSTATLYGVLKS
jgi:hypothetical protein